MKNENKALKKFRVRQTIEEIVYAPNAEKAVEKFVYDRGTDFEGTPNVYEMPPPIMEEMCQSCNKTGNDCKYYEGEEIQALLDKSEG